MVGIQLYIETETIKRPFSPNWFEVYSDFALQFILLSVEKERHKIVADYLQRFLIRMSLFHFWLFYKPKRSTPVPFIKWLCFTCVTLSSVQKVYLDIIHTIFINVPLIFLFLQREMLSLTRGPVCWSSIPYICQTRWFFLPPHSSLKRQLVLKSQHEKRCD